ncbi:MAG: VTT domain-containing protein [Candidatus Nomurabacteria bacterium]|nr:VTT domain-containing protein [Candidatus Nomurabacteria bacterium]
MAHIAEIHASIVYLLIILGVIIEGEIMVIIAGIFAHLGSINIYLAFLSTVLGGGIKSMIGYSLGYYLHENHSDKKIISRTENRVNYFLPNFLKKPFLSLFLSRFLILGIYWFALIYAGYKKINLRTFIKAEASSLVVWAISMLSIGFFFSYTALSISRDVRKFVGIILLFFVVFFILEKIVAFIIELFELEEVNK